MASDVSDVYDQCLKDLQEVNTKKKDLKRSAEKGEIEKNDEYWLQIMDLEDDEMVIRIDMFNEEFKKSMSFKKSITEDMMHTCGDMQRYAGEAAKAKRNRHKAKRFLDKLYSQRYEYYRRGNGQIQLKTAKEYDIWIGKDSQYARTDSYVKTYDILIDLYEQAVKQLSQKIFALQSIIKSKEYDSGPF